MTGRRVLLVHPTVERYGGDKALLTLAGGLVRRGWDVRVALPGSGSLSADLDADGVDWVVADSGALRRVYTARQWSRFAVSELPRSIVAIRGLARDADVVHVNSSVSLGGVLGGWAARRPVVLHVRESYADHPRAWRGYARLPGRCARRVLAISSEIRDEAARAGFGARVELVHDGLDLGPPGDPAPGSADELHLVAVGRLNDWKGHGVVIDAAAELHRRGIPVRCTIAGSAYPGQEPVRADLEAQIARLGLGESVHLPGFVDDVPALMATATVFVLGSTRPEPFGLALVEAMAQGVACVATDHGGPVDIIERGRTGLLVPPRDPMAMAEAVELLWRDPTRRAAIGAAAARSVRERFTVERMLDRVEEIYADVIG